MFLNLCIVLQNLEIVEEKVPSDKSATYDNST